MDDTEFYVLLDTITLKDCPFCGSDDLKKSSHTKGMDTDTPYRLYSIHCCSCGVSNYRERASDLFGWWNHRE